MPRRTSWLSGSLLAFAAGALCGICGTLSVVLLSFHDPSHAGANQDLAAAVVAQRPALSVAAAATGLAASGAFGASVPLSPVAPAQAQVLPAAGGGGTPVVAVENTQPLHMESQTEQQVDVGFAAQKAQGASVARDPAVDSVQLQEGPLVTASVILVCRNEHKFLQRTLDSILESTPTSPRQVPGLSEVIVVDDGSAPQMETALRKRPPNGLVRFLRMEESVGLMRARIRGGRAANGDVLVFLDCHVKPTSGWLLRAMTSLEQNPKRVVIPSIPVLDDNWDIKPGTNTVGQVFNWGLNSFQWIDSPSDQVMVLSGGLFAITRSWWFASGEYDEGMTGWGSEQVEQSFRVWLCGGEIVVDRQMIIGHYYRDAKSKPYREKPGESTTNMVRAVEVWLDDYKANFYQARPDTVNLAASLDISDRLALKRRLGCQPFRRFVEMWRPHLLLQFMVPDDRAQRGCRWRTYAGRYLGAVSWVYPAAEPREFAIAALGQEHALESAKAACEELGVLCAGVTCNGKTCSARKGTPFMGFSPSGEVSHLKLCCTFTKLAGQFLRTLAFVAPIIRPELASFKLEDLPLAMQRCETMTDLCAGVTCDGATCSLRQGDGGPQISRNNEVSYIKKCGGDAMFGQAALLT